MAAEIVEVAKAVLADLASDYEDKYIVKRGWHVATLWQEWGTESKAETERIRIFVVPVAAPRSELIRGYEEVNPEISIAVCKKTDSIDDQDDLVSLAVEIAKAQRRKVYTTAESSLTVKVTTVDHIPASSALLEKGVMASLIRLTLRMEVAHG